MATTGKASTTPRPGRRKVGARVNALPECSGQTFPIGALLIRSAGSIISGATGIAQSTGLVGLAAESGQNLTTHGLKKAKYYAFEQGQAIKLTFAATWTGSAYRGATAALSMNTAGVVTLVTAGGSSAGIIEKEVEWDTGVAVADGDINPVVYFVPADAAIAS